MTQKELLYYEDAIGHECSIIKVLEETNKNLQDEKLVEFIENELTIHNGIKDDLLSVLEGKVNE